MNEVMRELAAAYWVDKLDQAVNVLRLIASHPVSNQLEAAAMKQLAHNFLLSNGYLPLENVPRPDPAIPGKI